MNTKQIQNHEFEELRIALQHAAHYLNRAQELLSALKEEEKTGESLPEVPAEEKPHFRVDSYPNKEEIIEGIFDGKDMQGPDGMRYPVPENYASKSKLVEGDSLKLTITPEGRFIYKQIGPCEREVKRGILLFDDAEKEYVVRVDTREYKVLKASITYHKGELGDEVIVHIPKGKDARFAAVEAVVKALASGEDEKKQEEVNRPEQPTAKVAYALEEI